MRHGCHHLFNVGEAGGLKVGAHDLAHAPGSALEGGCAVEPNGHGEPTVLMGTACTVPARRGLAHVRVIMIEPATRQPTEIVAFKENFWPAIRKKSAA